MTKKLYLGKVKFLKKGFAVYSPEQTIDLNKAIELKVSEDEFLVNEFLKSDVYIVTISEKLKEEIKRKPYALIVVESEGE